MIPYPGKKIWGMDVGRHYDQSVLMGISDKVVSPIRILHGMDFVTQAGYIHELVGGFPLYLDVTGLGRGLADILQKTHKMQIVPIIIGIGTHIKPHRDGYIVGKQYLISLVNMSFNMFTVGSTVAEDAKNEFRRQLAAMLAKPGRHVRFEGKSGVHDDMVIAYAITLLGAYLDDQDTAEGPGRDQGQSEEDSTGTRPPTGEERQGARGRPYQASGG